MQQNFVLIIKCNEVFYMKKDLPKVFAVPINKSLNNNEDLFISNMENDRHTKEVIDIKDINKIFNDKKHVYKTKVQIVTKTDVKEVEVVGLQNNSLLTLKGESIPIDEIIEIKKV